MKRIGLFLLLLTMIFSGCKKEENRINTKKAELKSEASYTEDKTQSLNIKDSIGWLSNTELNLLTFNRFHMPYFRDYIKSLKQDNITKNQQKNTYSEKSLGTQAYLGINSDSIQTDRKKNKH